jgi:hypothetical protein
MCNFDVSGRVSPVRGAESLFQNVSFSKLGCLTGADVDVHHVLEPYEHLLTPGLTWNNAPDSISAYP